MITVLYLRSWLSDYEEDNRVVLNQEFTDSQLLRAIDKVTSDLQMLPPVLVNAIPANTIPDSLIHYGALANIFEIAYIKASRNRSNLSEENIPVPVGENASFYKTLYDTFSNKFTTFASEWKQNYDLLNTVRSGTYMRMPHGFRNN